jgi:hypothetical protein
VGVSGHRHQADSGCLPVRGIILIYISGVAQPVRRAQLILGTYDCYGPRGWALVHAIRPPVELNDPPA